MYNIMSLLNLQDDSSSFVYGLIPEAVLCIKASNEKARSASYTLLVVIGEALQRWHTDISTDDIVREFLKVVLAGLAGSPSLVYCTLLVNNISSKIKFCVNRY